MTAAPPAHSPTPTLRTRQDALAVARAAYRLLARRVEETGAVDPEYVEELTAGWEDQLAYLNRFRSDASLPDSAIAAVRFLTEQVITVGTDDVDAMIRWLDGYPDAISEIFPPSSMTFQMLTRRSSTAANADAPQTKVGSAAA